MGIIAPGTDVPEFTLRRADGEAFTRDDLAGKTTILVFFPKAFSPVCNDQLSVYEEVLPELREQGADQVLGVSTDATDSQSAFREKLGSSIELLSDFEPKGETARAFGAYFEPAGFTNRALVVVGPDLTVAWSHLADSPGDLPGANLLFDGLAAAKG